MPVSEIKPFDRRHDLDALRAAAMLLGIGLHGALAYVTFPAWPVYDDRHHQGFDLLFFAVHGCRMPLFFMLSGFFTAMLWRKRGLSSLIKHRARRILLPLVIFTLTIVPLIIGTLVGIGAVEGTQRAEREKQQAVESLWLAAKYNDVDSLEKHLASAEDVNEPDGEGFPALNWAALNGSTEAARMLIEAGADVDVEHKDGSSALSHAAFTGSVGIAMLLIDHGAELNSVNEFRNTALDNAELDWGTVEWVAGLLALDLDRESAEAGRKRAAELLLENGGKRQKELAEEARAGADAEEGDARGITAGYLAFTEWPGFHEPRVFSHLWFLWFLCILIIPFMVYAWIADRRRWTGPPRWLFLSPALLLWLVPLTMIPQWFHGLRAPGFGPDTSETFFPLPHIVVLHGVFFFFGALYFDCDDREGRLGRRWWLTLPVALLVVFPLGMALTFEPDTEWITRWIPGGGVRPLAVLSQALFAWMMTLGLMGLFRKICARENKTVRYVSDSSYWLYVAHLPLIFVAQALVKSLNVPAIVKFAIVCAGVTTVLLLTYDLAVRYTWLGTLLNGKRTRPSRKNQKTARETVAPR